MDLVLLNKKIQPSLIVSWQNSGMCFGILPHALFGIISVVDKWERIFFVLMVY
jgi:hypothetical protein